MQKLVLAQLLEELPELKIVGVDADKQEELVKAHNVSSIPTLILYKQGEPAWTLSGAKPLGVLREKVLPYV
jgi:thioredoxin 1